MLQDDWSAVDAAVLQVLAEHDGVAKMSMFTAADLANKQVASAKARGLIERPRNGWYCRADIPWQGKHAIRVGGVLSCISAADSFGLPTPPGSYRRLHVLVPLNSARIRHHRDRRHYVVPGEDREVVLHWATTGRTYPGWRTPLIDTLLQLVDCVPEDWFVAALDAALHRPWEGESILSEDDYARFSALLPRRKRRLLELVDPLAGSCLETLLRLALGRRGIGPLWLQFSPDGRRFVDILVGDRLIVEADGEEFHDPAQDAIRDAFFRSLGYIVLRFPYDRIINELESVLDEIEAALQAIKGAS